MNQHQIHALITQQQQQAVTRHTTHTARGGAGRRTRWGRRGGRRIPSRGTPAREVGR